MVTSIDEDSDATLALAEPPREHEPTAPSLRTTSVGPPGLGSRYAVLEQVGAGGMGVVHRAYDSKLRREVALKMLRFDRRDDARARRAENRILREARAMAQLSHPNVLPVYDVELGETLLDADDPTAALRRLEAALPLLATPQIPAATLARARFALARALVANAPTLADRDRARRLAEDARAGFEEDEPAHAEVSAWLDAR